MHLVLSHAAPHISLAGAAPADLGVDIRASAERIGMHLGEPDRVKLLRGVWLRIDGPAGTEVSVEVGAAMAPDESPTWQTAQTFTVGTSAKVDCFASGRYLALRLSSVGGGVWRLRGLELDVALQGGY